MSTTWKRELPIIAIAMLPTAYLLLIWKLLPDVVPTHWNIKGEIDGYGNKTELIFVAALLPWLIYIVLSIVPRIDPKGKLGSMGNKLHDIKFLLTFFMSFLAMWILYSAKRQTLGNANILIGVIGILFLVLGNYFKTIKPNYFIGIKTPWALENEKNWRETHRMAGKLWFGGGLLIVLLSFILNAEMNLIVSLVITVILVVIPLVYSYFFYKKENQMV